MTIQCLITPVQTCSTPNGVPLHFVMRIADRDAAPWRPGPPCPPVRPAGGRLPPTGSFIHAPMYDSHWHDHHMISSHNVVHSSLLDMLVACCLRSTDQQEHVMCWQSQLSHGVSGLHSSLICARATWLVLPVLPLMTFVMISDCKFGRSVDTPYITGIPWWH
jgi:hypothetical protein